MQAEKFQYSVCSASPKSTNLLVIMNDAYAVGARRRRKRGVPAVMRRERFAY